MSLQSSANSWDRVFNYVSKLPEFKEIENECLADNCQSCPSMVIVFIKKLLENQERD